MNCLFTLYTRERERSIPPTHQAFIINIANLHIEKMVEFDIWVESATVEELAKAIVLLEEYAINKRREIEVIQSTVRINEELIRLGITKW